jgi:phosphopantothenoylcysteine decarboxylase/phosphopantothenate--cysteine ligase
VTLAGRRIVVGVCGGIAAYKAVELARRLTQDGAEVQVVMTPAATQFVGPLTFAALSGHPVISELFGEPAPGGIPHTSLARAADLVVVAPATADLLARAALGLADDVLSALLLATRAPLVMAPAMHTEMWEHPATAANVATLTARGVTFVGPDSGALAGPDAGPGRMAEVPAILAAVAALLGPGGTPGLRGRRVVVSAGGTQEPLDPVRYIGNRSSGRMGYELARSALARGADVTLVTAPSHLAPPAGACVVAVRTAAEMHAAVIEAAIGADAVIMAAAVADWRPAAPATSKLKKGDGPPRIDLEPTEDILAALGRRAAAGDGVLSPVLVGFAAETGDPEPEAAAKLAAKGLDMVVGNLVGVEDSGFEAETNRAVLVDREGRVDRLPLLSKADLAGVILDAVQERFLSGT